jgi:O-antigen ligase
LQEQAEIPHEHGGQVHSGWIDFGLAFGIPGLLFIFITLLSTIYFGLKSKSPVALPWVMICLAFIPFGLIAEISYKQYFEATIFFLTLGSTVIIFTGNRSKENLKNDLK